ncbi:hypothetical protein [Archangium sp.]|uniref:hypothetical protein n=1 Tax=Archangium sp. TaxID=1872627 RepID=UPI00389982C2
MSDERTPAEPEVMEPTFWRKNDWTARVIKNEEDYGWAVEIHKQGHAEPSSCDTYENRAPGAKAPTPLMARPTGAEAWR